MKEFKQKRRRGFMQVEVGLSDLLKENPVYFKLTEKGRSFIFQKISNVGIKKFSSSIGRSRQLIDRYKHKNRFIGARLLRDFISYFALDPQQIEPYIYSIKRGFGGHNKEIKAKLPIKPSPGLALLIAKTIGDGSVCSDYRFTYTNTCKELIDEVHKTVNKSVGRCSPYILFRRNSVYEIKFPSIVGFILLSFGAPKGFKTKQTFDIPEWIKHGDEKTRKYFLRGLYDDESCVDYKSKRYTRRIILAFGKSPKALGSHMKFLSELKIMLRSFNIYPGKICFQGRTKNAEIYRFTIQNKSDLTSFNSNIGFTHPNKRGLLKQMINSYKR